MTRPFQTVIESLRFFLDYWEEVLGGDVEGASRRHEMGNVDTVHARAFGMTLHVVATARPDPMTRRPPNPPSPPT